MGWTAFANIKGERDYENERLEDPFQDKIFKNAYNNVKKSVKHDIYVGIRVGEIEGHFVSLMLTEACWILGGTSHEKEWSAEKVRYLNKNAEWSRCTYDDEDEYAFYMAKYFLRACALAGVSISFSW